MALACQDGRVCTSGEGDYRFLLPEVAIAETNTGNDVDDVAVTFATA